MEDLNLIIDSSNISEIATFTASYSDNAYISIAPYYDANNSGIIGVNSNQIYIGLKNNGGFQKLLEINNNNLISYNDIIPSNNNLNLGDYNNYYSNICSSNIYANNITLNNILNINLILNQSFSFTRNDYNVGFCVNFQPLMIDTYNNNYFEVPVNGLYAINYSLYSDNINTTIWINKSDFIGDNNNHYGSQSCMKNNNTSVILLLNKNEKIYFCISIDNSIPSSTNVSVNTNTKASIILLYSTN
jgi:hypothetical protein